jgi:hypothetical protein
MKTCSFCGKPAKRYASSARDTRVINIHCRRWWCRFTHAVNVWWRNVSRGWK